MEKNKVVEIALTWEKEKYLQVLTQSNARFSWLNEISSCKAFRLGQKQALLDLADCGFSGMDAFDVENHVEMSNYKLEHYIDKENLKVDFTEELEKEEASVLEENTQASHSNPKIPSEKDQVKSCSADALGANPSELEGCLKVSSNQPSSKAFDDLINIKFS